MSMSMSMAIDTKGSWLYVLSDETCSEGRTTCLEVANKNNRDGLDLFLYHVFDSTNLVQCSIDVALGKPASEPNSKRILIFIWGFLDHIVLV